MSLKDLKDVDLQIDKSRLVLTNSLGRLKVIKEKISLAEEPPTVEELTDLLVEMSEIDVHLIDLCASLVKILVKITGSGK